MKGLTDPSLFSGIVSGITDLCNNRSRSWDETSFERSALSSTDNLVMEDLKVDILGLNILGLNILGLDILGLSILNLNIFGLYSGDLKSRLVENRLVCKWSGFQMGSENWKPNRTNDYNFVKNGWGHSSMCLLFFHLDCLQNYTAMTS